MSYGARPKPLCFARNATIKGFTRPVVKRRWGTVDTESGIVLDFVASLALADHLAFRANQGWLIL